MVSYSIVATLLCVVVTGQARGQHYYYTCSYDSSYNEKGLHNILFKQVELDNKKIFRKIKIGDEGEIVNHIPAELARPDGALFSVAINTDCFCKNTSAGMNETIITIINGAFNAVEYIRIPEHMIFELANVDSHSIFIAGGDNTRPQAKAMDGIYIIEAAAGLVKISEVDIDYYPNSKVILGPDELARRVGDNIYFDVFDSHYFLIKLGEGDIVTDTIRLEYFETRNMVVALMDSSLYVFSLNYETHLVGEGYKGYGHDWIAANLRRYDVRNFALMDSIPIPDYPEGDFISGSYGPAELVGPYIVYYFGESNDLGQLYPAMLFIFDTRTNEATWLRVGWR